MDRIVIRNIKKKAEAQFRFNFDTTPLELGNETKGL